MLTLDKVLKSVAKNIGIQVLEVWRMKEYSFTEAQQHFASILDEARKEGVVCVKKERVNHFI